MSFLAVLIKITNYFPADMDKSDVHRVLDNMAVATASEILALDKSSQKISFQSISSWYSSKGFVNSSWIELLDLRKWTPLTDEATGSSIGTKESMEGFEEESYDVDEDEDEEDEDEDLDDTTVYASALIGQHSLVIRAYDTQHVFAISHASGLSRVEASHLINSIQKYEGPSGCIRAEAFQHFVQNFIPLEDLTTEVRNGLVKTLFRIFKTFEEYSNFTDGADIRSLSMGLTLFCVGNKSNKLATGFHVFDVQRDGFLTKSSTSLFLSSFLLVLTALGTIETPAVAFAAASFISQEVCTSLGTEDVTFSDFGEWYNAEGFRVASWIELLNLDKWSKFTAEALEGFYTNLDDDEDTNDDDEDGDDDDRDENAFSVSLHTPIAEKVLDVSKYTAREVLLFKHSCASQSSDFQSFVMHLVNVSRDGLVRKSDFESVVRGMGFDVRQALHASGSFLLRFFDAFDRSSCGYADTIELITGATILFDGSKSSKLMFAFELFDDRKRGELLRTDMWRFLRSFLTTILLLCSLQPSDKFQILVDEVSEWTVDDMLKFAGKDSTLSFDDLSSFYAARGFQTCSWLELLDLEKWKLLL